jgi:hypothetical protein
MKSGQLQRMCREAFDRLMQDVEAGRSERLIKYLKTMSRFRNYSFGNMLLILMQKPDAQRVAGFWTWKQLKRSVKKGEHGLAILVPLVYRWQPEPVETPDGTCAEETETLEIIKGFKTGYVFDESQTEGMALVEFSKVNGQPGQYLEMLKTLVAAKGVHLDYSLLAPATQGMSCGGRIVLKAGMTAAEEFSVLCHELSHELLHRTDTGKLLDRKSKELEAEAVAYVVCSGIGLDSDAASADYLQLYQADRAKMMESLERIQRMASEILWAVKGAEQYVKEDYRVEKVPTEQGDPVHVIAEAA